MIHCSMKSLDIGEDECDSPDEGQANNLRDSMQVSLYSTSLFSVLTLNLSLNVRCFFFFSHPALRWMISFKTLVIWTWRMGTAQMRNLSLLFI